jgi:uncharacterized protein (TIRG00374 family)
MLLLSVGYIALKAYRFVPLMRPVTNLPAGTLFRGYLAGTAATLLPGGVAARAGLMSQAGVPVAASSAPVAFSSILDQVVFVGGALIAALWYPPARQPAAIILGVLLVGIMVFAIPFTRRWLARAADWVAQRVNALDEWRKFLQSMREVGEPRIMLVALALTVLGAVLHIFILDLAMRGVGAVVSIPVLFLAYVLPTMLGRLSGVPGGVGVTEAGMVGFLASTTLMDPDQALAAVAVYRIATVFFQALLGALVYFFFWRGEKERAALSKEERERLAVSEREMTERDAGNADLQS